MTDKMMKGFRLFSLAFFLLASLVSVAHGDEQPAVGYALVVKGDVNAINDGDIRQINRRGAIFEGDIITTAEDGNIQMRMIDGALISLAPSSEFVVSTYRYQSGDRDNVAVSLLRGGLRTISGKIEKTSFRLETPTSTLAIRGTVFDVFVSPDGTTTVVLREGAVELAGLAGGIQQLSTPGLAVVIAPGQAPSAPGPVPPAIQQLLDQLFAGTVVNATWERGDDGRVVVRLTLPGTAPDLPGQQIIMNLTTVPPIVQTMMQEDGHPPTIVLDYCQQNPLACAETAGTTFGTSGPVIPRGPGPGNPIGL